VDCTSELRYGSLCTRVSWCCAYRLCVCISPSIGFSVVSVCAVGFVFLAPFACVCVCLESAIPTRSPRCRCAVLPETVRGFGKVDERHSHVNPSSCARDRDRAKGRRIRGMGRVERSRAHREPKSLRDFALSLAFSLSCVCVCGGSRAPLLLFFRLVLVAAFSPSLTLPHAVRRGCSVWFSARR